MLNKKLNLGSSCCRVCCCFFFFVWRLHSLWVVMLAPLVNFN